MLGSLGNDRSALEELERKLAEAVANAAEAQLAIVALERELAEKAQAHDELERELERERQRQQQQQAPVAAPPAAERAAGPHLLFATIGTSYELVERDGAIPQPGETIELGGATHDVARVGRTPGSDRPTVYLTPH
jgi:hypothetical protein